MVKTLHVVFDGKMFLPKEPVNIQPNTEWVIVISDEKKELPVRKGVHPLEVISQLATDMGAEDLSENFDHYIGRRLRNSHE